MTDNGHCVCRLSACSWQIATDTSRNLHQQLSRVSNATMDTPSETRTARPVSAPVRRSKTTTATPSYPAALRDRVSQTTLPRPAFMTPLASEADSREEVVFTRQDSPMRSSTVHAELARVTALLEDEVRSWWWWWWCGKRSQCSDRTRDTTASVLALCSIQRKKNKALKAANAALTRQSQRKGIADNRQ